MDQVKQVNANNNITLSDLISQQITERSGHRITFADYMDLALYHPQYGYYAATANQIGAQGDFFTSPHLGADFGELLAEQFVQMWQIMQRPQPFTLVEMGAGQGLLAADILHYLRDRYPEFYACLNYMIVERAAALITEQQRQLHDLQTGGLSLSWRTFAEIPSQSIIGCFFSNELVDALPVHQVMVESGQLREVYVTVANQPAAGDRTFTEVTGDLSTSRLADYFQLIDIDLLSSRYPSGYRSEVNLAALDWMATVADRLKHGYVLTIDYGYTSDRYYHPNRNEGTLQCYYHHAHHSDPYIYVGQQDITAHIDFTALMRQGEQCGLSTIGFTRQGLFLMALGLGDRIAALSQSQATDIQTIQTTLRRRDALHLLANPMGLGNFGVLIQGKAIETTELLQGLAAEQIRL
ncbi:class I SAM-dependent methyltransferase [Pantanalinema rosaneae CENA516]|uniref:class I SAM-dependent methyltransferase n=1 Tax=Pantanalinema rosaneae TaxID=1620701 RepID=UPI003D6DBF48